MLCLSNADLKGVISLDQAMTITEDLYRQYAAGSAVRMAVQTLTATERTLRISGGAIGESDGLGVRLNLSGNRTAVAVLFSMQEGELLATMPYPFSTLRTAALVGVTTRHLSRPESSVMAMIGTGRNALGYCDAICNVRPIEEIRIYSRDRSNRERFADRVAQSTGRSVRAVDSVGEATAGAAIACVATSSNQSVLEAKHLAPGTFVVSMGRSRELDSSIYRAAQAVVISYRPDLAGGEAHLDENSQLLELVKSEEVDWTKDVYTLGSVVVGTDQIVPTEDGIVVFRDFQTGFGDIALALAAYRECVDRGRGVNVDL